MAETKGSVAKKTKEPVAKEHEGYNGLAVAGFVCSVAGLLTGLSFLVGLILSSIGLSKTKKTGQGGHGMALAGVIIGAIGTGLTLICVIIFTIFVVALVNNTSVWENAFDKFHSKCTYEQQYDSFKHKYNYELICE